MCDPPRIYPSLPEYTPPFQRIDTCDPSRIYSSSQNIPPFQQMHMCDPPSIYPSLPESTPFSTIMCDPPRIYPCLPECTPLLTTKCDLSRIYPSLLEYTPTFFNNYIIITLPESTLPSQNISPFSTIILSCDAPRIYPSLTEYTPVSTTMCDTPRNWPTFWQLYAPLPLRIYPSSPFYNYVRYSKNHPLSHLLCPLF